MPDYIEREALIATIDEIDWYSKNQCGTLLPGAECAQKAYYKADEIYNAIHTLPAADVAPVVHGEWVGEDLIPEGPCGHIYAECSICQKVRAIDKYCPNCGAKMDGENTNEDNA